MSFMNDGGPAFPVVTEGVCPDCGMSLRDYFAAKVLSAIIEKKLDRGMEMQQMREMTTQNQPRSAAEVMLIADVIQGLPVNLTQAASRMGRISLRETANRLEEIGISVSDDFLPYRLTHEEHGGLILRYTGGQ